jgi:hypothetical protein
MKKLMALAVGLGLVAAVGTQASAETAHLYPPHAYYGWHGGWRAPAYGWRAPVVVGGGWGYGYYAPHRVWVPGYWVPRPYGRVWVGGYWR